MKTLLRITIEHDSDTESPCDWDDWKLYSFSRKHASFKHPDAIREQYGIGLTSKLRHGTAFWCGYFEHGQCQWKLSGEQWQCPWDSVDRAGILIWEHKPSDLAKSYSERKESARAFLEIYTDWCNGCCYFYGIDKCDVADDWDGDPEDDIANSQWKHVDSCGGYIGESDVADAIRCSLTASGIQPIQEPWVRGDSAWIRDYHDIIPELAIANCD